MKSFFITVNNGLLEKKHYSAINEAVWLFMWLLDKMTIIDAEKGEGKVLGGKGIKFEEIEEAFGISRSTYKRWVGILRDGGYISTIRTPYGLSFVVYKAKKVFGQRGSKNEPTEKKRRAKDEPLDGPNMNHQESTFGPSNIDKTINKTVDSSSKKSIF